MMFAFSVFTIASLAPLVLSATLDVNVGPNGLLEYQPPHVQAVAGDIVRFHFNPKNHTVTQSSFDTPCSPLADGTGFRTGFVPVQPGTNPLPYQDFTVPDNHGAPLWFYCGQTGHCGQGMVFAINPPASPAPNSFEAFRDRAIAQNGPGATTAPPTPTPTTPGGTYTTPPPPKWTVTTATVTWSGSVYTTTYTSYEGTPEPTPAAEPQTHRIVVGADGLLEYSPANITAQINDTVVFEFRPKNHTVTQSSFLTPCQGLPEGFRSGFQPVAADATTFPEFSIKINDTAPIWGYCGQVNHCQQGMVFSINAVESGPNNFAAFKELAQRPTESDTSTGGSGTGNNTNTDNGNSGSGNGNGANWESPALGLSGLLSFAVVALSFVTL